MTARLAAAAALAALLAGCASTVPPVATSSGPTQRCALDTLHWSLGFVPRATSNECVTILDTVNIGN